MNRQLYQMGGIGTLPMDFGQPLQVSQPMMNPSFGPMQPMSNPMLNYGQTPLTMAGGGITRLGYQEGGMDQMMMKPQMQEQMMQPQINPSAMDAKQALELIIQMLIEKGIPPEQAREIAIQMVQAVAEGGMEAMSDQRIEARFGGMMSNGREQYGVGSFLKSAGKAISSGVKGITNAVKDVVSSDLGKIALTAAAIYASGGGFGISPEGFSLFGSASSPGLLGAGSFDLGSSVIGSSLFGTVPTDYYGLGGGSKGLLGNLGITSGYGADLFSGGIKSLLPSTRDLVTGGLGFFAGRSSGGPPKREDFGSDEEYEAAVARYKAQFQTALNQPKPQFAPGLFPNNPFYPQRAANGGRIGYQGGGISDLISQVTKQEYFGTPMMANGGRMNYGLGDLVRGSSIVQPVSATSTRGDTGGGEGSGFFGSMISRLIRENPQMFKPINTTMRSPRTAEFIDLNQNGIDDRDEGMKYGGRMGYAEGTSFEKQSLIKKGYGDIIKNMTPKEINELYDSVMGTFSRRFQADGSMPMGEPRKNQAGVTELDYRQKGGFVPPIGIKEKADDIPAMLSNNEFVFTADAVRNAGDGNVNKGAQRMYSLMKNLEAGGIV